MRRALDICASTYLRFKTCSTLDGRNTHLEGQSGIRLIHQKGSQLLSYELDWILLAAGPKRFVEKVINAWLMCRCTPRSVHTTKA